jgi:hypothetical protein
MDDNDTLRQILGFFAMMLGTLMDPISLPCYIASGLFFKRVSSAMTATIGFYVISRVVLAAIQSKVEAGIETAPVDMEVRAASFVGAVLVTGIAYFFASRYRKAAKEERKAHDMTRFTKEQITTMHGFLPYVDGRVICARLRLNYNPGAPEVILPGDDEDVRRSASFLCKQGGAIPIYIWRELDGWEYVGDYEVESFSELPADIAQHARSGNVANIPISSVIRMRKVLTK